MPIQLSLFNHKGGVSKTTTAFNLGWMMAKKGKKVLLADCDPQCNLTGMVLGFKGDDDLRNIYEKKGVTSIYEGLRPAFEAMPKQISKVECIPVPGNNNLLLMPGHISLSELEVTLGIAQSLSDSLSTLQNLPGSFRYLFDKTAKAYKADVVIVDMSPSLGAINQNLLMTSDYFIVPTAPDFFSTMAIESLAKVLPRWGNWATKAAKLDHLRSSTYPFKFKGPKFLGTVIQNYKVRTGNNPSKAFKSWIEEIQEAINNSLIPALKENKMYLNDDVYKKCNSIPPAPILQMGNFNSLIAQSQKFKVPVYGLSSKQIGQSGIVLERTLKSMKQFEKLFEAGADKVLCLMSQ